MQSFCLSALHSMILAVEEVQQRGRSLLKLIVRTPSASSSNIMVYRTLESNCLDAISLHTTPGIGQYRQLEVELLFNGVGLDVLGIGYETFPEDLRRRWSHSFRASTSSKTSPGRFLRVLSTRRSRRKERSMRDICSHFIRNYKRSNFYEQIQEFTFSEFVGR